MTLEPKSVVSKSDTVVTENEIDNAMKELRDRLTIPLEKKFEAMSVKFLRCIEKEWDGKEIVGDPFVMYRPVDKSGVSGSGVVTIGRRTPSGTVIFEWLNRTNPQVNTTKNGFSLKPGPDGIDDLLEIHGHDGGTVVVYLKNDSDTII
jgi:hypothetical protein